MGFNIMGGVKHVLNSVESNTGEGILAKVVRKSGEVMDDLSASGSEVASKLRGNFEPAEAVTNTLKLDTEGGYDGAKNYFNLLDTQAKRIGERLESLNKSGIDNESIIKRKTLLNDQSSAIGKEIERVKSAIGTDADGGLLAFNEANFKGKTLDVTTAPGFGSKTKNLGENIKRYYTEGDASTLATRAGVTAGAYGAGAVGLRYMSGGNLGTNANGESDIAGIPFI